MDVITLLSRYYHVIIDCIIFPMPSVYLFFPLDYLTRPLDLLSEAGRVLRPGGAIFIRQVLSIIFSCIDRYLIFRISNMARRK